MARERMMASQSSYAYGPQQQPVRSGGQALPQQHLDQLPQNSYGGYPGPPHHQDSSNSASGAGYAVNGASGSGQQAPRSQHGSGRERDRDRDGERRGARQRERADQMQYQEPQKDAIAVDEETLLQAYGLVTLQPDTWADSTSNAGQAAQTPGNERGPLSPGVHDEPDPLGLYRGGVLANVSGLGPEGYQAILLQCKGFNPSTFISTLHSSATPEELRRGRDNLQRAIDSGTQAMLKLVDEHFDRFIGVKAVTSSVYDEMKVGPLSPEGDYSVAELKESLKLAGGKADDVWNPILEARLKADRLRSTLGIFEKSRFFFTLPGILSDNVKDGKYDAALSLYKKGKYLLDSRPGALLGLPPGAVLTDAQREKHSKVFEKVWSQVDAIMHDLQEKLTAKLRNPNTPTDDIERTIAIMLELETVPDPAWLYLESQHRHILEALRKAYARARSAFAAARSKESTCAVDENVRALDLQRVTLALEAGSVDIICDTTQGSGELRSLAEAVHKVCAVFEQTVPAFWRVSKDYIDGKYHDKDVDQQAGRKNSIAPRMHHLSKHSTTHVKTMSQEAITLFVSLFSELFQLTSERRSAKDTNLADHCAFLPAGSNALTNGYWMLKILAELSDCANEIGGLPGLGVEGVSTLKEFISSARWRFTDCLCQSWLQDTTIFYRLEDWQLDPEDPSKTRFIKRILSYQRAVARYAYRTSGGSDERAQQLFAASLQPAAGKRLAKNESLPSEFSKRIHDAYIDALYAFLDGVVHMAMAEPIPLIARDVKRSPVLAMTRSASTLLTTSQQRVHHDVDDIAVRHLITISNLTHFTTGLIETIADTLQTALNSDVANDKLTLTDVITKLDAILFEQYLGFHLPKLAATIEAGINDGSIDWRTCPRPTEVRPYMHNVLISVVFVHAQVSAIARPLVHRTISALFEQIVAQTLESFRKVSEFGLGGELQSTLEMEFLQQSLEAFVSPAATQTLHEVYKYLSDAYPRPPAETAQAAEAQLQREVASLRNLLHETRRATALQFLCFRQRRKSVSKPA